MAEDIGHGLQRNSCADHQCGCGVAQVVKPGGRWKSGAPKALHRAFRGELGQGEGDVEAEEALAQAGLGVA